MVLIAIAVVGSPVWYWQIQRFRAQQYIKSINPRLKTHPVYHDIDAWKTLKGPILLSFSGSLHTDAELAAFKDFIASTHPPEPYTIGVFVLPDSQ